MASSFPCAPWFPEWEASSQPIGQCPTRMSDGGRLRRSNKRISLCGWPCDATCCELRQRTITLPTGSVRMNVRIRFDPGQVMAPAVFWRSRRRHAGRRSRRWCTTSSVRPLIAAAIFVAASPAFALPPAGAVLGPTDATGANTQRDARGLNSVDDGRAKKSVRLVEKPLTDAMLIDAPARDEKAYVDAVRRCAVAQTKRERDECE
jgi:hypothetical protein